MANPQHLAILEQGVTAWNRWRRKHPRIKPDLSGVMLQETPLSSVDFSEDKVRAWQTDLHGANLARATFFGMDLRGVNFLGADLRGANLSRAVLLSNRRLRGANLTGARLVRANLRMADLTGAILVGANFGRADLTEAELGRADLTGANLKRAIMVETNLTRANLTGCSVYGISAWDLRLTGAIQANLIVTPPDTAVIETDNLEVAQFIYLLLHNEKIRDVIDTVGKRAVLILGRFTQPRKVVLEAMRRKVRDHGYVPILFDFEKPGSRDLTETVSTLAHMSRFILADITDAKSIPQELERIVPDLPSVPVQPLLLKSKHEYGMFEHFRRYPWVLEPFLYRDQRALLAGFEQKVIAPAEAKVKEQAHK